MKSINKVVLQGALGRDPEVRRTQSGSVFVNLNVATDESWKDKQTGDWKKNTEWHRVVVAFAEKTTEDFAQRLTKGSKVYLEGKIVTRKRDKDGKTSYTAEIIIGRFGVLRMADGESEPAPQRDASVEDDEIPF